MVPTPILDLQQDPPKPIRRWWIWAVVIVIWSIVAPFLTSSVHLPPLDGWLFFPVLYAGIALHEAGHLVAGRLGGMRPGGIAIGGFLFHKSGRNWVYRFDYRRILSGGIAKPLPPKGRDPRGAVRVDGRRRSSDKCGAGRSFGGVDGIRGRIRACGHVLLDECSAGGFFGVALFRGRQ